MTKPPTGISLLLCLSLGACALPVTADRSGPDHALPAHLEPESPALPPAGAQDLAQPEAGEGPELDLFERRLLERAAVARMQDAKYRPEQGDRQGPPRDELRNSSAGLRPDRFYAEVGVAFGDLDHDDEFYGSDEIRARQIRLLVGGRTRKGLGLEGEMRVIHPLDNAYEGSGNELDVDHFDLWFKFWAGIDHGRFRMPLRVGPHISVLSTELESTLQSTDYVSFGVRFELEPEVILTDARTGPWVMSIYSKLGGGLHVDAIDDEVSNEEFSSTGTSFHAEIGARAVLGGVNLSTSWLFQRYVVDESEREAGFVVPRVEDEFHGLMFTMGVRF